MGKARRIRNAVIIVSYGKDARIVLETQLAQDFQCPKRLQSDRITGGAVAFDLGPRLIFEDRFGATHVPAKSLFVSPTDHLMTIAMTANFMAAIEDMPHETRTPFSHPSQHEKCRADSAPIQEFQQPAGIAFNSHRIPAPLLRYNDVRKRLHVEIIFDIDCQRVHHVESQRAPEPKRITLKLSKMIWRSNTGDMCLM